MMVFFRGDVSESEANEFTTGWLLAIPCRNKSILLLISAVSLRVESPPISSLDLFADEPLFPTFLCVPRRCIRAGFSLSLTFLEAFLVDEASFEAFAGLLGGSLLLS